jgi:hypothetical protein
MIMCRFLFLIIAIPALALAQEKEPDMEVSGLTLLNSPFEEIAVTAQNSVQSLLEKSRLGKGKLGFETKHRLIILNQNKTFKLRSIAF